MSINVKCSQCDYFADYMPDYCDYRYPGLRKYSLYPQISYAWCHDCNKFVPIQKGINFSEINALSQKLYQDLITQEKLFIKSKATQNKISSIKEQLKETIALEALIDNHSSQSVCIECNGNNIVYKDIKNQIWRCPKCRIGLLILHETKEDDDILYRRSEEIIYPQTTIEDSNYSLYSKAILCGIDMINNEGVYFRLSKNLEAINSLTMKVSLIDRICLIYAVLVQFYKHPIPIEPFVLDIVDNLISSNIIMEDVKALTIYRFDERIKYFKKGIEIEQNCSAFIPTAIIKTLRNPQSQPTHNIVGVDIIDAMKHWKVIMDTIGAYFDHKN